MKASGTAGTSSDSRHSLFAACFGVFLALSMLKFGNPPIFESFVTTPANVLEFLILFPWPIRWAYFALGALAVFGFLVAKKPERMPGWIGLLPAAWWVWQLFATAQSIDPAL